MCPALSTVFQLHNECKCTHPPNVMSPYCNNSTEHASQPTTGGVLTIEDVVRTRPSLPPVLSIAAYTQPAAVSQSHCTRSPVNYGNGSALISDIIHLAFNPLYCAFLTRHFLVETRWSFSLTALAFNCLLK